MREDAKELLKIIKQLKDSDDNAKKHRQRYTPYQYLWKTEDEAWMAQRKEEWRSLYHVLSEQGYDAKELKSFASFYLSGEEISEGTYMESVLRFLLTPFNTPEEAQTLYELVGHPSEMQRVADGFMGYACESAAGMPWLRAKVQCFAEGVLGKEYKLVTARYGKDDVAISPDPTTFCSDFIRGGLFLIKQRLSYHYCLDTLPYFLSALLHATRADARKRLKSKLEKLLVEVAKIIKSPDDYPELVQELAQQLSENEKQICENWAVNQHLDEQ